MVVTEAAAVPSVTNDAGNLAGVVGDRTSMRQRSAIDALRAEAQRRERPRVGITKFQVTIYAVLVLGIVLIAYARATMP